ncbi:Major viral transcription factor ICP4-like protein [Bienertia sinuspersici]
MLPLRSGVAFGFEDFEQYSTTNTLKAVKNFSGFGCISPSVFKAASLLANEQRVSLAIPVLASIYRGLNDLSNSSTLGKQREHFPAHCVCAWIAQYFRSHRMTIHNFAGAVMVAFHGSNAVKALTGADTKASIRSVKELSWVVNSMNGTTDMKALNHSPHHFGRQFGFCHDVPGELKPLSGKISLKRLRSLFQTSVRLGTKSLLTPSRGMNIHSRVTSAFAFWWKSIDAPVTKSPSPPASLGTGPSRKRKADNTTREETSKAPATSSDKVKNKVKPSRQSSSHSPRASSHGSSDDKSVNVFQDIFSDNIVMMRYTLFNPLFFTLKFPLLNISLVELSANFDIVAMLKACNNSFGAIDEDLLAAASDPVALYAASTIIARNSEAVHAAPPIPTVASWLLVKQMKTKLLHTPLSNIHALDLELKELFGYITSKNIDVASLREHVEAYVSRVRSFHALESSENVQPSLSSLVERLTGVESRLSDVVNLKRKEEEQIISSNELKKELNLLEQKESQLSCVSATFKDSLATHDETIKN